MNKTVFDRVDENPVAKRVSILFEDGTIDVIDKITGCSYTVEDSGIAGICVMGDYHAFAYKEEKF